MALPARQIYKLLSDLISNKARDFREKASWNESRAVWMESKAHN